MRERTLLPLTVLFRRAIAGPACNGSPVRRTDGLDLHEQRDVVEDDSPVNGLGLSAGPDVLRGGSNLPSAQFELASDVRLKEGSNVL